MPDLLPNLRDLGGIPTADGRSIRPGRVLRSALPLVDDIAPEGVVWPPTLVFDLRSAGEVAHEHPLVAAGARVVNLPLLAALRPGEAPRETLHELYLLVLESAAPALLRLVEEVVAHEGPVLVHCAAGKDRTGVSVALLLRLVGVGRDDVVADYLLTQHALADIDARLSSLPGAVHRSRLPAAFFAVAPEAIAAVLDVWDEHDGGVHGWFRSIGGDDNTVEDLRRTLLA